MNTEIFTKITDLDQGSLIILYVIGLFGALGMFVSASPLGSQGYFYGVLRISLFVGVPLGVAFGGKIFRYYIEYSGDSIVFANIFVVIGLLATIGLFGVLVLLTFSFELRYLYGFIALESILFVESIIAERQLL
jgi:hypothetical protein